MQVTKQNGTVATVRMGAVLSRAVATGVAARSITAAETQIRELRASAGWVLEGHNQLSHGLRHGHAVNRIQVCVCCASIFVRVENVIQVRS